MPLISKVVVTGFGDESKLAVVEADLPDPGPHEVQIAVEYTVVAGSDVNMRRGTYPMQRRPPLSPGYSIIGSVIVNGARARRFQPGDRVACLTIYEGQSTLVNLPEKYLVPVPPGLDLKAAVALILDWVTAYQMLHQAAKVKPGQRIFVHGLSGGVGTALLQLGRIAGAEVFGTASSRKHEVLKKLGATPFSYENTGWIAAMQKLGGADAVFDSLGYESFDESYAALKPGGILVGYGINLPALRKVQRGSPYLMVFAFIAKNLLFWHRKRTTFFSMSRRSESFAPDLQLLFQWLKEGKIFIPIKGVFSLDEIQKAHREYENSAGTGSIVIEVAQPS
jgi:NADPH:quinone reductase-like Zn-dependent oxidoreductase